MREFRLFVGVVALALLPGIGAAYADPMVVTPTSFFASGTFLEGNFSNGATFTITLDDQYGNPVTYSNAPLTTSTGIITMPLLATVTGYSFVFNFFDAMGNPLIDYAGAVVQSQSPQESAYDLYFHLGNATGPSSYYSFGLVLIAAEYGEDPAIEAALIQRRKDPDLNDPDTIHDPQYYLTVGGPSLGGNIPALTPNPNLVPEPSSILLLASAAFLALAASRRKNSCRLLRNAGVKYQRSS